jgi:hypothetical protein
MDPGSGMGKKSGSGYGMNNPDHIPESLEIIFCFKILKFFDVDPGSGMEKIRIRDPGWKKFGSGIQIKHTGSATLHYSFPYSIKTEDKIKLVICTIYIQAK